MRVKEKTLVLLKKIQLHLEVSDANGKKFFYIPACASIPDWLLKKLDNSELIFFDGTLWQDDEMINKM